MRICPSFVHWMLTDWRADGGTILQGSFAVCPDRISSKDKPDRSILNLRETERRQQCFLNFIYSFTHLIWIIDEIKQADWCLSISSGVFSWRTDGSSLPRDRTVSGQRGRSELRRSLYNTNTVSRQRIMRKDMLTSQGQRVLTQPLTSSTMTD